jgi:hypothetical protein
MRFYTCRRFKHKQKRARKGYRIKKQLFENSETSFSCESSSTSVLTEENGQSNTLTKDINQSTIKTSENKVVQVNFYST